MKTQDKTLGERPQDYAKARDSPFPSSRLYCMELFGRSLSCTRHKYVALRYLCHLWPMHKHRERGGGCRCLAPRSEEHTSELQSLMRISYAVFCLKQKRRAQSEVNTTEEQTLICI